MPSALFLNKSHGAKVWALPRGVQFRFLLARKGGRGAAVDRAHFVKPSHDSRMVKIFAGVFAASHCGMQAGFRDGQPELRCVAGLSALQSGNTNLEKLVIAFF